MTVGKVNEEDALEEQLKPARMQFKNIPNIEVLPLDLDTVFQFSPGNVRSIRV